MNPEQPPVKKDWPRWAVSPEGLRAIFDCSGDLPPGWALEVPLPKPPKAAKVKKAPE